MLTTLMSVSVKTSLKTGNHIPLTLGTVLYNTYQRVLYSVLVYVQIERQCFSHWLFSVYGNGILKYSRHLALLYGFQKLVYIGMYSIISSFFV